MSWWDVMKKQQAVATGQWGFALQGQFIAALPEQDLMTAEMPEGDVQPWTVNLMGWRYSTGALSAASVGVGSPLPSDNQTTPASYLYARVTWGTSGRSETALVDYPVMGVSFGLNASSVRVGLTSTGGISSFGTISPTLGGAITPAPRSIAQEGVGPTFSAERTVALMSDAFVGRARRAVAYRVMTNTAVAAGDLSFSQMDAQLGIVFSRDQAIGTVGLGETMADARAMWFPLHPQAQAVRIRNASLTTGYIVTVQYLLDLG